MNRQENNRNKQNYKNTSSDKKRKKKRKKKRRILRFFLGLFVIATIVCAMLGGVGLGVFMKIIQNAPNLDLISVEPNVYTSIVYDSNDKEIDRFYGEENREYVSIDEIPKNMQDAIVAVEDERFYSHFGIDIRGILRAGYITIKNKITGSTGLQGASTITQQLIKNNVTKVTRNTLETKLQEQYLAIKYEKKLEKKFNSKLKAKMHILELYLNTIALGHGYNGVQAASLGYFNKDVKDLTLAESACIVAITNNPSLYSPRTKPENNKKRVEKILNHMLEQNMITKKEYDDAIAEDIYSKVSKTGSGRKKVEGNIIHGYFEDALFEQVSEDMQKEHNISEAQAEHLIYSGGLQIYSTKDTRVQKILEDTYLNDKLFPSVVYKIDVTYTVSVENTTTGEQKHTDYRKFVKNKEEGEAFVNNKKAEIQKNLKENEKLVADKYTFSVQPQSSMVVMDYKKGNVVGMIGGRGEKLVNRGFNRAVDSKRQPGSVFKILAAYAPAIDTNTLMPGSVLIDEPFKVAKYEPENWYKEKYRGASTVRDGVRDSMNILAVKAMNMTGVDTAYKYLLNFGFSTLKDDKHLSTALGGITYGVTQMEVTNAFATIANGGNYYKPKLYKKVLDKDGKVILDVTGRKPKRVIKETTAFLLTDMMQDVVAKGTGTAAKFKNMKMNVAGKTGTTQETRDLTFVGYTPYYVAGIWFGYDRYDEIVPSMMARVGGKRVIANDRYHLNIWREAMEKINEGLENKEILKKPDNIVSATVCLNSGETGLLATSDCKKIGKVATDYFVKGTEPKKYCNKHQSIQVCEISGKLAGDFCPKESVKTRYLSSFSEKDGEKVPTQMCDIHIEGSVKIDPNSPIIESHNEDKEENKIEKETEKQTNGEISIYPSDLENTEQSEQTTIKGIDVIVPSVPQEQTTENVTEATTQSVETTEVIVEETVGEPMLDMP